MSSFRSHLAGAAAGADRPPASRDTPRLAALGASVKAFRLRRAGCPPARDLSYPVGVTPAVLLPYHQDERLDSIALPGWTASVIVEPSPARWGPWQRLATLYDALVTAVPAVAAPGKAVAVVSGDCLAALGTLAGLQRAGIDPSGIWFDAQRRPYPGFIDVRLPRRNGAAHGARR